MLPVPQCIIPPILPSWGLGPNAIQHLPPPFDTALPSTLQLAPHRQLDARRRSVAQHPCFSVLWDSWFDAI